MSLAAASTPPRWTSVSLVTGVLALAFVGAGAKRSPVASLAKIL